MYYSKSTRGFYDATIHTEVPAGAVEITAEEHAALLEGQSQGKLIDFDDSGRPFLADPAPPSVAELAAIRRGKILVALGQIDAASARPLRAILGGSATDEDRARLTELDEQAAALRAELATLEPPPAA